MNQQHRRYEWMRSPRGPGVILIVAFLALLLAPAMDGLFDLDPSTPLIEGRRLRKWPSWTWKPKAIERYPMRVEETFYDRFGFRDSLIRTHSRLMVEGLGVSPSGLDGVPLEVLSPSLEQRPRKRCLIGEEGFLFFTGDRNLILADYRGLLPFSQEELVAFEIGLWERQKFLRQQGCESLFVVAPDKQTIYPEYMPDSIRRIREGTRLDQLTEHLKTNDEIAFLDLRTPLLQAKQEEVVFELTGTHWNDLGAHAVYVGIMNALHQHDDSLIPTPRSEYHYRERIEGGIDLARIAGLGDVCFETVRILKPRVQRSARRNKDVFPLERRFPKYARPFAKIGPDAEAPRLTVFRDSFTTALVPFLSQKFSRSAYYWVRRQHEHIPLTKELVDFEEPDFFLDEWVERALIHYFPHNDPEIRDLGNRRRFQELGQAVPIGVEKTFGRKRRYQCVCDGGGPETYLIWRLEVSSVPGSRMVFEKVSRDKSEENLLVESSGGQNRVFYVESFDVREGDTFSLHIQGRGSITGVEPRAVERRYLGESKFDPVGHLVRKNK